MDRIINSASGYPLSDEWLAFFENQSIEQIEGLVKAIGNNVIVSGVIDDNGTSSSGYIIYNNELLPFDGGSTGTTVNIIETVSSEGYDTAEDDSFDEVLPVWKTRKAKFLDPGDVGVVATFSFNSLSRLEGVTDLASRLQLLKSGTITTLISTEFSDTAIATGDFIGASILPSSEDYIQIIKIHFLEVPVNYIPIITSDTNTFAFDGHVNISVEEQTSTSLTIEVRRLDTSPIEFFNTYFNIYLIG
jgi:hypothetical protein